jgi:hypothetical protein
VVDWVFWKGFLSGAASVALVFLTLIKGIAALKSILPNRAKPQLLDIQNCCISIGPDTTFEPFWFELLVNNAGSKDCSVISVELRLPNGDISKLVWASSSTRLPKTIAAGQTERITRNGQCGKPQGLNTSKERLALQPQQNSVEGTVVVKFNTNKIIEKKTIFTVTSRFPCD